MKAGQVGQRFVRMNELERRLGFDRTTIYRWISEGRFPAQVKVGRFSVWWESDVVAWMEAQGDGTTSS